VIRTGDKTVDFDLPAANAEGRVSLAEHRARGPVLVALFRGLYCPFSRHQMARLAASARSLAAAGVGVVGVIATEPERARTYFRARPLDLRLGCDPTLATHEAYGLGHIARDTEAQRMVEAAARQLARELGVEVKERDDPRQVVDRADGFHPVESDQAARQQHQIQFTGQFLVDREGIVRWCNREDAATYAVFPDERTLLSVAGAPRS
jgi:peroxiredoxin